MVTALTASAFAIAAVRAAIQNSKQRVVQRTGRDLVLGATRGTVTTLVAPAVKERATVHVILEVEDGGTPNLSAYRRAVITVSR